MKEPLLKTLTGLRGNPRACVYTEPLWGISIYILLPYASVYMLAIGLSDFQVGFIASVYMFSQVICAFFSGPITDKLGRRKTVAIFDFIAWNMPCLIWWRASNFWYFFIAALVNGTMQIVSNAWNCLLIEDAEKSQITRIHSLVVVAVQLSSFLGPIVVLMFSRMTLVPAMHVLYLNGFVIMTAKIVICYYYSRETQMGLVRMAEARGKSIFSLSLGYGKVLKIIGKSRGTIFAMTITVIFGIAVMINNTFWQVIVNKKLLVPDHLLPFFPILKSSVAIVFLFFIAPHLSRENLKFPLLLGFCSFFAGQTILVLAPAGDASLKYIMICVSLVFDGLGFGALQMLSRALVALNANPAERARVMAVLHMIIMAVTSPFGWIAGLLSSVSRNLPFVLNLCLLAGGVCVTIAYYLKKEA